MAAEEPSCAVDEDVSSDDVENLWMQDLSNG